MKIIQINAVYEKGSTGRTCMELSNELWKHGHEVYTAYSSGYSNAQYTYKIGTSLDKKIHALCSRLFGLQGYYSINATKKLLKYMDNIAPDIVHLRNLHANYINLPILLKYLAVKNIATVITLHDCWFFTGKCTHYTSDNCFKWQTGCNHCPRLRIDNKSWFFDRTSKMWKDKQMLFNAIPRLAVVGVSDWIKNEAKASLLKNALIIDRVYNWIDLNKFYPDDDTSAIKKRLRLKDEFTILSVASKWSANKGINQIIKLATESNARIIIVGSLLSEYKLPVNIIHINNTNDIAELRKLYSLANVYISFSKEESFGKTVAEALSCGTPAIVYNSTGLPELIGDDCGYSVDNYSELLDAIKKVINNGKPFYTRNCRKFAENHFSMYKNAKKYVDIYQRLCEGN